MMVEKSNGQNRNIGKSSLSQDISGSLGYYIRYLFPFSTLASTQEFLSNQHDPRFNATSSCVMLLPSSHDDTPPIHPA